MAFTSLPDRRSFRSLLPLLYHSVANYSVEDLTFLLYMLGLSSKVTRLNRSAWGRINARFSSRVVELPKFLSYFKAIHIRYFILFHCRLRILTRVLVAPFLFRRFVICCYDTWSHRRTLLTRRLLSILVYLSNHNNSKKFSKDHYTRK